jgi:hypothetical protein
LGSAKRTLDVAAGGGPTTLAARIDAAASLFEAISRRRRGLHLPAAIQQPASQIIQRQFRTLLVRAGLERDVHTRQPHTIYSLRHTAICMRIVNSQGKVNIFTLAKNAGTSVDQIERFYARHLPMSPELWHNLQSLGGE